MTSPAIRPYLLLAVVLASALRARPLDAQEVAETTRNQIDVYQGRSSVVSAPWAVQTVSVTDAEVADVQILAADRVLVYGKRIGTTDLLLWSEAGDLWQARVTVTADLESLKSTLVRSFPGAEISLEVSGDVVLVKGSLARSEQAETLRQLLDTSGFSYVDMTRLAGVQQVQIQVRVAEVSRTAVRALGVNAFIAGNDGYGGLTIGPSSGGALNPINIGVPAGAAAANGVPFAFLDQTDVNPLLTLFGGFPDANLAFFVQALSENQYLRILAEPTLVALSGEQASFLAGGEFPIPVVQGGGAAGGTSISIEYKEFGVRLSFEPIVLGEDRIRLKVAPEVSELTDTGAIEIEGFSVPAVFTRRAETTLELQNGQTFAMAGLLSSTKEGRSSRVPVLGDLPILGPLFRSVRYSRGETELVVIVTASLVEPLSLAGQPPLPGTIDIDESDWEIFLEGSLDGNVSVPYKAHPAVFRSMGLDRLRGPGAWASHSGRSRARSTRSSAVTRNDSETEEN